MKSLHRFLVPNELTVREFADVLHKRIDPGPEKEISLHLDHDRLLESNLIFIFARSYYWDDSYARRFLFDMWPFWSRLSLAGYTISAVDTDRKSKDGFLHISYAVENKSHAESAK